MNTRDSPSKLGSEGASDAAERAAAGIGAAGEPSTSTRVEWLMVETTTYCNLRCAGCSRTVLTQRGEWTNRHLTREDFRKIVTSLPYIGEFVPHGVGEPTLHPDLPGLIGEVARLNICSKVSITTNGDCRPNEYYDRLFGAGLTNLYVSVDSLEPELTQRLRAGTKLNRLRSTLGYLIARYPSQVAVRTVISRHNQTRMPELLAALEQLGSLTVFLDPYDNIGNADGCLSPGERRAFVRSVPDLERSFPALRLVPRAFDPPAGPCRSPWRSPVIGLDGELAPCCRSKSLHSFGNVLRSGFGAVWNGAIASEFRSAFSRGYPGFCTGCPLAVPGDDISQE